MEIKELSLPGVKLLTPKVFHDHRGYFLETHRTRRESADGEPAWLLHEEFVQGNLSSSMPWTMRGLHYQLQQPQGKLVRCVLGRIWDVAVDIRVGSPTFGKYLGVFLDDTEHKALYVPPGFAHGFLALGQPVRVQYECTTFYHDPWARAVNWKDPALGIGWPIERGREPIISNKDRAAPMLADIPTAELPVFDGAKVMAERAVPRFAEGNSLGTGFDQSASNERREVTYKGEVIGHVNDAIEQGESPYPNKLHEPRR